MQLNGQLPKTREAMVQQAIRVHAAMKQLARPPILGKRPYSEPEHSRNRPYLPRPSQPAGAAPAESAPTAPNRDAQMKCYQCGRFGHRAATCWFRSNSSPATDANRTPVASSSSSAASNVPPSQLGNGPAP
jgi:hypothetical protein